MDYILSVETDKIDNFKCPSESKVWNKFVLNTLKYGKTYELNSMEKKIYESIFDIKIHKSSVEDIYNEIYLNLLLKFNLFYNNINDKEFFDEDNKYILIPKGHFSSLTLNIQYMEYNNLIKEIEKFKNIKLNDNFENNFKYNFEYRFEDNYEDSYEDSCEEFFKESYEEKFNSVFIEKEEHNCCLIS